MAPTEQILPHKPQPVQRPDSIFTWPSSSTRAGQPISVMQVLQWTQRSGSIRQRFVGFTTAIQGDLKITALTPSRPETSFTVFTASSRSRGSTVTIFVTPTASSTFSMLTLSTTWPIMV